MTTSHPTRTRTSTVRALATVGIAAAAMVAFAGSAGAAVPTHQAAPGIRVGMADWDNLTNLVPFDMQLTGANEVGGWGNGDYPGQNVIHSGYGSSWGITNWVDSDLFHYHNDPWNVQYQFTDTTGSTDTVTMALAQQSPAGTQGTCTITGDTAGNYTCTNNGNNGFYVAAANPQNLSQANRDQFAQSLASLCNGPHSANGNASCTFTPAPHSFRYFVSNTGFSGKSNTQSGCYPWIDGQPDPDDSGSYSVENSSSETNSFSDSLTESVELGIDGVATAGISNSTTYGQEFTNGVSYTDSQNVAAHYGTLATAVWYPVDAAITGDFTATLGGATYTLNGVTLTSTLASGAVIDGQQYGEAVATVQEHPMNTAQWNKYCPGDVPPTTLAR